MSQQQAIGPAPAVTLKAIGHGRRLTFNAIGTTALLLCAARETRNAAPAVVRAVREQYSTAGQVLIATITDTRSVPKLIRKVAEQIMKSSYNDAVKNLAPGRIPEDYVLIVPDWDGALLGPLGINDVTKTIAAAVISRSGDLVGVYQGEDPASHALALLEQAGA
jgi:hypothetical protein